MIRRVPLFGSGYNSLAASVTAQDRIGVYFEKHGDGDKSRLSVHGMPGLRVLVDRGVTPHRGLHSFRDYVMAVQGANLSRIDNAGAVVSISSALSASDNTMKFSDDGVRIVMVDGVGGYHYNFDTVTFSTITDPDFPTGARTVTWIDGYFIVEQATTQRFYISTDGLAWDALDFDAAQGHPDKLLAVVAHAGEVIMFGERSMEFWANSGNPDFPFARIGSTNAEWGLAARNSYTYFDNSVAWLAKNRIGEVQAMRLDGYTPRRISNHDIETIWNGYDGISDAIAYAFKHNGHPFWVINFTEAGATWFYDGSTGIWARLMTGTGRHRGQYSTPLIDDVLLSDYSDGKLYLYDKTIYDDNGTYSPRQVTSRHFFANNEYMTLWEVTLDMESGVGRGSGQGYDPQIMLTVSKDGGHTWTQELWTAIGKQGEYRTRARWTRLGAARDFVLRFRVTDPIKFAATDGFMMVE